MNRVVVAVAALTVAGLGVVAVVEFKPTRVIDVGGVNVRADDVRGDEPKVVTGSVAKSILALSKLAVLPDGGTVAYLPAGVLASDAGDTLLTAMPCVRRKRSSVLAADCMRQVPGDIPRDFGKLARFPAANAVGTDCEPVPCSVWAGDTP